MHLDEERLQRLIDGELSPEEETSARAHLTGCESCRQRFDEAEREQADVFARLRVLDDPPPVVRASVVAARARETAARPRMQVGLAWAAGLVIALGLGGLASAVPGSPFHGWITALTGWIGERGSHAPAATDSVPGPEVAGVSVAPGGRLVLSFLRAQPGGQVRIVWTDEAEVEVRAPRGAATFDSGADTLRIDDRQPATFEVRIPRAAPHVEIEVQGTRIFSSEAGRVTGPMRGSGDGDLLPLEPGPLTH